MFSVIRIYTDSPQYSKEHRSYLADLLRPLINRRTIEQNRAIYGAVVDQYILVDSIDKADWAVLPLAWNYYHYFGKIPQALAFIEQARKAGKPVLTWVLGDYGARVPAADVWIFGAAGDRRRAPSYRFGLPVFIRDPLPKYGSNTIAPRPKGMKARIGFCGYSRISPTKAAGFALRTLFRNTAFALRLTSDEPQDLYPAVLLRQRILGQLRKSLQVETDFIQRSQYKAGASTPEMKQQTHREFFENIRNTDYTVCIRGGGNFSTRLYQTLAMGRIPILVDTDCLLPFANDPRWQECCVYVSRNEVDQIAEKVRVFHDGLSESAFLETQHQARRFWEENLSFEGFFTHLPKFIVQS
jgi:Exostosin family